ncbi:type I-E CRISPR-associated protein Cse2/CasB [Streptomyces sp. AA1529]|uniref:type I-E CRISPR-associated protein Cse2/CasB n=1 Tax=Streptomyces sp. AA1529 TaxID=1203257 RepID=UPI003D7509E9
MSTDEEATHRGRWYWENFAPEERHSGADLAILRKGVGREAGDVWQISRYYRSINRSGETTFRLAAEHAALTLFALHQQSQPSSMHRAGVELGTAARRLHTPAAKGGKQGDRSPSEAQGEPASGKFSEEAVDRRMNQVATATDRTELVAHLRGLVTMLRGIGQPLDYTQLLQDIERWHYTDARVRIRARWGSHYFDWGSTKPST